jgi:hypothetical protein
LGSSHLKLDARRFILHLIVDQICGPLPINRSLEFGQPLLQFCVCSWGHSGGAEAGTHVEAVAIHMGFPPCPLITVAGSGVDIIQRILERVVPLLATVLGHGPTSLSIAGRGPASC